MRRKLAALFSVAAMICTLTLTAGIVLAAAPSADLDQCANDSAPSPSSDGCNSAANQWVNGNLGPSKSVYLEGDSIPYRLRFGSLSTTGSHTVTIEWDTTKAGKHALDYITDFNESVLNANPCLGVTGCNPGIFDTEAIPDDPQVTGGGVTPLPGSVFRLYGGTITGVSSYFYATGTGFEGDKSAGLEITFTASVANPVLAWGGHIATRLDWGESNSAVTISGSPYHTRLLALNGKGGNQDRSLSAAAVIFPGSITIIKDVSGGNDAQDFSFTTSSNLSSFSLDDDGDNTNDLSNTKTFGMLTTFGQYTVTETAIAGWSLTGLSCQVTSANGGSFGTNLGTRTATINLAEGENYTCTFTNFKLDPELSITKTDDTGTFDEAGDVIEYTIVATNSGNVALSNVTVTDPNADTLSCTPTIPVTSLAVGASITCDATIIVTQADVDAGSVFNAACVDDGPGNAAEACDDVTTPGVQDPSLLTVKVDDLESYDEVGDVIHYTITVTNDGNVTLSNVTVTDPNAVELDCDPNEEGLQTTGFTLAPGEDLTCTAEHVVTQADLDAGSYFNEACASSGATSDCGDVTTPGDQNPSLAIDKVDDTGTYDSVGDVIEYLITATNDGNVTLASVTVTDPNADNLVCVPANGSSLAPGESLDCTADYTITQADIDAGSVFNAACVDDGADGAAEACDDVTTPGDQNPSLAIDKVDDGERYDIGDVITYTIKVTNIGNVTLDGVTVTDPNAQNLVCVPATPVDDFAPGDEINCTASHTATADDLAAGSYFNEACADDGDATEAGAAEVCDDVTTPAKAIPGIATEEVFIPQDTITLSGLDGASPQGELYVELRINEQCGADDSPAWTYTWENAGNGDYHTKDVVGSPTAQPAAIGADATVRWCTSYSGDADNAARPLSSRGEISSIDFDPVGVLGFGSSVVTLLAWALWSRRRKETAAA